MSVAPRKGMIPSRLILPHMKRWIDCHNGVLSVPKDPAGRSTFCRTESVIGGQYVLAGMVGVDETTIGNHLRGTREWIHINLADKIMCAIEQTAQFHQGELADWYWNVDLSEPTPDYLRKLEKDRPRRAAARQRQREQNRRDAA